MATWRMLEQFTPQSVPKLESRSASRDGQVVDWHPGDALPWNYLPEPQPAARKNKPDVNREWRHELFLGVFEINEIYDSLSRLFVDDKDAYDARQPGKGATAYVVVDCDGNLSLGSQVLSAALWGVGRVRDPGPSDPQRLQGFDEAETAFEDAIDRLQAARRDGAETEVPPPLDASAVQTLVTLSHAATGIKRIPELATQSVRIRSRVVDSDVESEQSSDFLNSYILDDLDVVQRALGTGDVGSALREFVEADAHPEGRVDLQKEPYQADPNLAPSMIPGGRWPTDAEKQLARSQQFAVNRAVSELHETRGLMSVNGPPGTGKTTMLRDVLAGLVVERARRIAQLEDPRDVFTGEVLQWKGGDDFPRKVHTLRKEFTGFEMVVASANNSAVENISRELPASSAIDDPWSKDADYFSELATAIVRGYDGRSSEPEGSDAAAPGQAWGLVAARLGRKQYRTEFTGKFWFGDSKTGTDGMQDRLKAWKQGTAPANPWKDARSAFNAADRRVRMLLKERSAIEARMRALREAQRHFSSIKRQEAEYRVSVETARTNHRKASAQARDAELAHAGLKDKCDRHGGQKPGFFANMMSWWKEGAAWRVEHETILNALDSARSADVEASKISQQTQEYLAQEEGTLRDLQQHRRLLGERLTRLEDSCISDLNALKEAHPQYHEGPNELRAPWLDEELDRARSDLFLAALSLHRDLLANVPDKFTDCLRTAREVINGSVPEDLEPEKARAAWQSFFMVVPLVSTTFASVPRMLGKLTRESLGWLFIDEAGQAAPQLAAGALWRFERALVVGDPLQLEPIASIPAKLALDIAHTYAVDEQWLAPKGSVQTLADKSSKYGTTIESGEESTWMASPLRVHRRCDDPMFTLSNEIAYNGLMISAVHRGHPREKPDIFLPDRPDGEPIVESYWVDRPATEGQNHVQPKELEAFISALEHLNSQGVSDENIIAISPFRAVADKLRDLTKNRPDLLAGTIHVAQGREADVVILVLGGAADRAGAKQWATQSPNLFNVAVSRARRRLYVIGDYARWAEFPYADQVAVKLPRRQRNGDRQS